MMLSSAFMMTPPLIDVRDERLSRRHNPGSPLALFPVAGSENALPD
jgi:hypothetical protein